MTETAQKIAVPRRRELDFLRGVALIVMTVGHPLRTDILRPGVDVVRQYYNVYGELFSAFFMFMSAINVTNFMESARNTPELDATRFYFKSSIALYFMGTTYNLCVGTLPVIDIIQCMAIGTFFVFMLLRFKVSALGLAAITLAFFGGWLAVMRGRPLDISIFTYLGAWKYPTALFGPIPWLGFFTYGLLIDRIPRGRWELISLPVFLAVFIAGHFLPQATGTLPAIVLYKANARYIVLALGLLPVMHLMGRRWYRGGRRVFRVIESWGVESLIFLIFHWAVIMTLLPFMKIWSMRVGETISVWTVSGVTLLLMWRIVPVVKSKRDEWMRSPHFAKKAWRAFFLSLAGWAVMMALTMAAAAAGRFVIVGAVRFLAIVSAFGAGFAFCFLYPHVRARLRRESIRKKTAESIT
jgi:hypothetical protein